ncbi:MAG: hypothetical protein B7Z75_12385 [Acidocella sp. 20-57-95]|nr:MAG: hypothetical protein B7Z75_12385 [Acidocella sp. 20-57-95]OYV59787.1 MAG: hypothetical protein B7Z71_07355 [Acidocella sp. 21-58-7]HQT63998.1 hypothetical protein [Acidocella sp.]HQU03359.1 hypothetical protein [Acidocella sp.]
MRDYFVEPLSAVSLASAYPLIRLAAPGIALATWKRQAKAVIDKRHRGAKGILIARPAQRPYICGMVWYRAEFDLVKGRVLHAYNLVAIDLLDSEAIILHLMLALGPVARLNGCVWVNIIMPDGCAASKDVHHAADRLASASAVAHCLEVGFAA